MSADIPKDEIINEAKNLKVESLAGEFFLVFWDDKTFGVVNKSDLINIAASTLKADVHGLTCEALYGQGKFKVTLLFRGTDEEGLFRLADKLDALRRKREKSQVQTKKRTVKRKHLPDFEMEETASSRSTSEDQIKGSLQQENKTRSLPKKMSKKDIQKEKKEREKSRSETISSTENWILGHVHASPVSNANNANCTNMSSDYQPPATSTTNMSPILPPTPTFTTNSNMSPILPPTPTFTTNSNMSPILPPTPTFTTNSNMSQNFPPSPNITRNITNDMCSNYQSSHSTYHNLDIPLSRSSNSSQPLTVQSSPSSCYPPFDNNAMPFITPYPYRSFFPGAFSHETSPYPYQSSRSPARSPTPPNPDALETLDVERVSPIYTPLSPVCENCETKEAQIVSLSIALDRATLDNDRLQKRIKELEKEKVPANSPECDKQNVFDHYVPSRGIQIEYSNYKQVPLDQPVPDGYERLGQGSEIVIPRSWLVGFLAKCKGKGPSFTIKKLLDGFFEPEDLAHQKASKLHSNNIVQAIRLYAIEKFQVKDSFFNSAVNSKVHTCKRAVVAAKKGKDV